jgi:hypothetical protein
MDSFSMNRRNSLMEMEMVEGVGFEPTIPFGMPVFKTGAFDHSATPPSYRSKLLVA